MSQLESTSGSKVDLHLFSIMSLAILKFQCEYGIPLVFYGCYLNFESSRWPMTLTPANNNKLLNWADLPLQICILFQYISRIQILASELQAQSYTSRMIWTLTALTWEILEVVYQPFKCFFFCFVLYNTHQFDSVLLTHAWKEPCQLRYFNVKMDHSIVSVIQENQLVFYS